MRGSTLLATALVGFAAWNVTASLHSQQSAAAGPPDKYLYLEDVSSPKAMDWVKEHDASTAKIIEGDPNYAPYLSEALKVAEDPSRLPVPDQHGGEVYNLWHDAEHLHGIWRKTTLRII